MAIFSRKQHGKKQDEQAKVILEASLEAKPAEVPDAEAPPSTTANAPDQADQDVAASATETGAAEGKVATPVTNETTNEVVPEPVTPPVVPVEHRFGIDDAILLMRSLPADPNMGLVVRVVRVTLGAVHVSIEEIIADAVRKEEHIKSSITAIETQMADLEKQLAVLRHDITVHQADLKETVNVREKLHMADQYPTPKSLPPPITTTVPRIAPSKPFPS
jgi:hypothetical protein